MGETSGEAEGLESGKTGGRGRRRIRTEREASELGRKS